MQHHVLFSSLLFILLIIGSIHCSNLGNWNAVSNHANERVEGSLRPISVEVTMSSVEIIINRGYDAEIHPVTTEDGYILILHRIPYPIGKKSGSTGRPVFIQHGIAESSADWLLLPSNKSLAFQLADLGYDVWLGNCRGNTYSRGHVNLDASHDRAYWEFSFDEMGRYDLRAVFNYILNVTSSQKLSYIGFSMGVTMFFTCMDYHPELNDKIELMVALAPVSTVANTKSPILRLLLPFRKLFQLIAYFFFNNNILSERGVYSRFEREFCLKNYRFALFCNNALFLIVGADYGNMDASMISSINHHVPAGVSVRTAAHFGQNVIRNFDLSPKFNKYDFGWIINLKHYGQPIPPTYDLSKVTVPVHIFHGHNDYVAAPKDVEWTASRLANVKQVTLVDSPTFNHIDFIFYRDVSDLVYKKIIALLPITNVQ